MGLRYSPGAIDLHDFQHIPKFTGEIWFVDAVNGNDDNGGNGPHFSLRTIGAAVAAAAAGDAITVRQGTYHEIVDLNKTGLELWCEIGAVLSAPGTVLTLSGDYCYARNPQVSQNGQVGIHVTGYGCRLDDCKTGPGSTIAFDIDGAACRIRDSHAGSYTVTGYDIGANGCSLRSCSAIGRTTATRGFYITNGADRVRLWDCGSTGNATAGFEVTIGCVNTLVADCNSGDGDGDRVDNGTGTMWSNFSDELGVEHHEHIYPVGAGEGAAHDPVTISNVTTDDAGGTRQDQNYWGDVIRIIPPNVLSSPWSSVGLYIYATTTAKIQQWQLFFTHPVFVSGQNGGNDWDQNETVLTVSDGSIFLAGDYVWITGTDRTDGEILKITNVVGNVITIASEVRASAGTGLRYDYDTDPSTNRMYLVYRSTDRKFHTFEGDHSAGSAKDFVRFSWHDHREVPGDGGMLIRTLNASDGLASTFDVRAIYED